MTSSRKSSKSRGERPVFDSIRKPLAPPGHPLSGAKPEERAHPAQRKVKHKHQPGKSNESGDDAE